MKGGIKIGYAQVVTLFDDDGEPTVTYLASIEFDESERNHGYGTAFLTQLAEETGGFYLCPENERCKSLYDRLGENVTETGFPDELQGNVDEYGEIYYI